MSLSIYMKGILLSLIEGWWWKGPFALLSAFMIQISPHLLNWETLITDTPLYLVITLAILLDTYIAVKKAKKENKFEWAKFSNLWSKLLIYNSLIMILSLGAWAFEERTGWATLTSFVRDTIAFGMVFTEIKSMGKTIGEPIGGVISKTLKVVADKLGIGADSGS